MGRESQTAATNPPGAAALSGKHSEPASPGAGEEGNEGVLMVPYDATRRQAPLDLNLRVSAQRTLRPSPMLVVSACRVANRLGTALASLAPRATIWQYTTSAVSVLVWCPWVLRLLGDIAAHADLPDPEAAEGHYTQALARAEELGMRPLAAHCHLGLGKLFHHTGDRAKAAEHLTIAATMYREMDMGVWLEKAEAELGPSLGTHSKPG